MKKRIPWNKGKTGINSEETRRKQSIAQKKRFEKEDVWNKGKKPSPKTLKKMSKTWFKKGQAVRKGTKHAEESKQKMSKSKKKLFASGLLQSPMKGKHHSEKTRQTHSEFMKKLYADGYVNPNKGKQQAEKSKQKQSENMKKLYESGLQVWNRGKTGIYSEDTLKLIKDARLRQVFPRKDSKIELLIQDQLREKGIEFEKHIPILGQPDVFINPNICIFADGDFHHANPSRYSDDAIIWKERISKTSGKHIPATTAKMIREKDDLVTQTLEGLGYTVLRFWEHEINKNLEKCIQQIIKITRESRRQRG